MCCFSLPVESVVDTNIFARAAGRKRQFLVYSLRLAAKDDLAMILPLPVAKDADEEAVKFINLEEYPNFFEDLAVGFPVPKGRSGGAHTLGEPAQQLKVVEVGSFVASFVPTVDDFARLDERFRLPNDVWAGLPAYRDFGFAVFQLKQGERRIHPMAFEFPRRDPNHLFFPTVHIHDGKVHDRARFDHALYCQASEEKWRALMDWEESARPAGAFMKAGRHQGLIDSDRHVHRRKVVGEQKNQDIYV